MMKYGIPVEGSEIAPKYAQNGRLAMHLAE
jgi:hypothetical protein